MSEDDAALAFPPVPIHVGPAPESLAPEGKEPPGVGAPALNIVPEVTPMADATPEDACFLLPRTQAETLPVPGLASGSFDASTTPPPTSRKHASRYLPSSTSSPRHLVPISPMPLSPGRPLSPMLETATATSAIVFFPSSQLPPSPSISSLKSPVMASRTIRAAPLPALETLPPPMERRPTVRFNDMPKPSATEEAAAAAAATAARSAVAMPTVSIATVTEALNRPGPRVATVEDDSSRSTSASSTPKPMMQADKPVPYAAAEMMKRTKPATGATDTGQQPAAAPSDTRQFSSELTAVDHQWGVLFANGKPTKRFEEVMESLACFMIEQFLPPSSIVIGPKKLASLYTFHRQEDDPIAHGAMLNSRDKEFHRKLGELFEEFGCQYHLVPADDRPAARPRVPALTPRGFTRWMQLHMIAFPDEEARRLAQVVSNFPLEAKSALDGRSERLPKQLSRYLLPATPDLEIRNLLRQAVKRHFGESFLAVPPSIPSPSPLSSPSGQTLHANDAAAGLRPRLARLPPINPPLSGPSHHRSESFHSSSRVPPPLDSKPPLGKNKRDEPQELNYRNAASYTTPPPPIPGQYGDERRPSTRADERFWDAEPGMHLSPPASVSSTSCHPHSGYYSDTHYSHHNSSASDKSRHSQSRTRRMTQSTASPSGGDRSSIDSRYPPPSSSAATRTGRGSSVKNLLFAAIGASSAAHVGASLATGAGMGPGGGASVGTTAAASSPVRSFSNTSARRTVSPRGDHGHEHRDRRGESRLSQEPRDSRDRLDRHDSRDRPDLRDRRASYPPDEKSTTRDVRGDSGSGAVTVTSTSPLSSPSSSGRQPSIAGRRPSIRSPPMRMSTESVHGSSISSLTTVPVRPSPLQTMEPVNAYPKRERERDRDRGRDYSRYRHHSHDSADPGPSRTRRDRDRTGGDRHRQDREDRNRDRKKDRDREPTREHGRGQNSDRDRDRDRERDVQAWQSRRKYADVQPSTPLATYPRPPATSLQSLSSLSSDPASSVPRLQRPRNGPMLPPVVVQARDGAITAAAATAPRHTSLALGGLPMVDGAAAGSPPPALPAMASPHLSPLSPLSPLAAAPRYDSDSSARSVFAHRNSASTAGNGSSHYCPAPRLSSLSVATMGRTASSPHDAAAEPGDGSDGGLTWDDYLQLRRRDRESSLR